MASTRNINTITDYCLQQRQYKNALEHELSPFSSYGAACEPTIPCVGYMPSHMARNTLSNNPIEIESALFGINSTNLVNPEKIIVPELIKLPEVSYFKRIQTIMPEPLVIQNNQRPFPVPK